MSLGTEYNHLKKQHKLLETHYYHLIEEIRELRKLQNEFTHKGGAKSLNNKIFQENLIDNLIQSS